MRNFFLIFAGMAMMAQAQEKSVALLFGPVAAEAREKAAATGTAKIYEWLGAAGTSVELRRTGEREGQQLLKFLKPKDVTQSLADSVRLGSEAQLGAFLDAIDMSVYALARKPGLRYLILALQPPALSADQVGRLKQTAELCQGSKVKVLIWDLSEGASNVEPWQALVAGTGGAKEKDLATLSGVLPGAAPPSAAVVAAAAKQAPEAPKILSHLFRTAPPSAKASGATVGAMSGDFVTELPMNLLQFDTQGGNATAKVRITQTVKNKAGEAIWTAKKELQVKTATSKLEARKTGTLTYMRRVTLVAGDYTLESVAEDLNAGTELRAATPATATDMIPGLALSGALIVRQLNKQTDLLEGDDLLSYDGVALMPMLGPVFPANEPFTLGVYFLLFPEIYGKQPRLRLDILQNGQVVGGTALAFTDKLRDDTKDSSQKMGGEQKHTFPYLAKLANAMLLAGDYTVKITAQQDSQEVSRTVAFRVVEVKK